MDNARVNVLSAMLQKTNPKFQKTTPSTAARDSRRILLLG
jgi:hypothetical protein